MDGLLTGHPMGISVTLYRLRDGRVSTPGIGKRGTLNVTPKRACCADDALPLARCLIMPSTDVIYGIQGARCLISMTMINHAPGNCPISDDERARVVRGPLPKIMPLCPPESPIPSMVALYVGGTPSSV